MAKSALDSLLAQSAKKWNDCEGRPECDLLRLVILRDLGHALHAEKSKFLSSGQRKNASSLLAIESRVEELRTCKPLTGDLLTLLTGKIQLKRINPVLPEKLFTVMEREKLERYDRLWEASLASEAISQGWGVWSLEAWVDMNHVDEWNRAIGDRLDPNGFVLYVESAAQPEHVGGKHSWHGRWVCLLRPDYRSPSDISIDFSDLLGTEGAPIWRILYFMGCDT